MKNVYLICDISTRLCVCLVGTHDNSRGGTIYTLSLEMKKCPMILNIFGRNTFLDVINKFDYIGK